MISWSRRWIRRIGGLLLLVGLLTLLGYLGADEGLAAAGGAQVYVIDGDSVRIGGRVMRLAGMDAVELHQNCRASDGAEWPCGAEARAALHDLVARGELTCETSATDRYGRAIGQCGVPGVIDVSAEMVAQGWAVSGDGRRGGAYAAQQQKARVAGQGIWRGTFDRPAEWRAAHPYKKTQ